MTPNKFPSFFFSLCLHLGLAALILFLPSTFSKLPDPTRNVLISGIVTLGKEGRAKPGPTQKKPGGDGGEQKTRKPVEKPQEQESKTVAQVAKPEPEQPKPEVKPVEKPVEKPKPEPKPEATPIPKEPEKKQPEKKEPEKKAPEKKPEKKVEKKPAATTPKKTPPKGKKKNSVEDALLALSKETKKQDTGSGGPKGQSTDDVLKSWEKEFSGSGNDERGDGPGGSGGDSIGVPGTYYEVIISRVKQNWAWTGRADRTVFSALVNIQISRDGTILATNLIRSSGNTFYDSAVMRALNLTDNLLPPPSPDLMDIDIEFTSEEMMR